MTFTASGLIANARSLADLQNTQFISHTDEINLINEAYRDIYSRYTESDGDYYATELVITIDASMKDPNNQFGYLIPMPAAFLKIRTVSYNNGGFWIPVQKFAMSGRDNNPSQPMYRLKNGNLWLIGNPSSYTQIKIEYYPIPQEISAPDVPVQLGTGETIYTYQSITSHYYDTENKVFFYTTGNNIKCENKNTGETNLLYTSANTVSNLYYYAGYVFWLESGDIKRAATDFKATVTPSPIVVGSVTYFAIQNNVIYYNQGADTKSANISGGGAAALFPARPSVKAYIFGYFLSISGGNIAVNGVPSSVAADAFATDGIYVYVLNDNVLKRYVGTALNYVDTIAEKVVSIGSNTAGDYLSLVQFTNVQAISTELDTVFDYPTNEVNEIMAYNSAMGYARKQNDQAKMALLSGRLTELWERFWSVNKRDEYQNTRINNDYQNTGNFFNW